MDNYALIDAKLAKSQNAIGESSNIAQLAQSYANTFNDDKYWDIVCILSVVAQLAIDSAKTSFDIDITEEIKEIKKSLNIDKNGYPAFWKLIQDKKLHKQNKEFSKEKINNDLQCPMNYLTTVKIKSYKPKFKILPMSYFFEKQDKVSNNRTTRRKCRKVEELIEKYSLELLPYNSTNQDYDLLIQDNFEQLIEDIKKIYISNNYLDLISWLIDRAFFITAQSHRRNNDAHTEKNKSLLLKTLYDVNPKAVLKCFSKNMDN